MRYDVSIDRVRWFLVLIMIYCHMLQFFGNPDKYPSINTLIDVVNVIVFPTFVFCFGCTSALAYLRKPFRQAAPRLARTTLLIYAAFVLSGIGYHVAREGTPLNAKMVTQVILLQDIPGWSEFLAGFAVIALVVLVLFKPLQWLSTRLAPTLIVSAVTLAMCFFPYHVVKSPQLGLFIGTLAFACFPAVQYGAYLLLGIYWQTNRRHGWVLAGIGLAATLAGVVDVVLNGLPQRFPPSIFWVLLTGFAPVALSFVTAKVPAQLPLVLRHIDLWARNVGRRSLFFLLASNLTIFTIAGIQAAPMVTRNAGPLWRLPIASPAGALVWEVFLIAAISIVASLAGRNTHPTAD